jgi:charged multivesicular body protein 2A
MKEIMKEFAKNNEKMEMNQELMNDQIDMAMDDGESEAAADDVYNAILGEVGMNMNKQIGAGEGGIPSMAQAAPMG